MATVERLLYMQIMIYLCCCGCGCATARTADDIYLDITRHGPCCLNSTDWKSQNWVDEVTPAHRLYVFDCLLCVDPQGKSRDQCSTPLAVCSAPICHDQHSKVPALRESSQQEVSMTKSVSSPPQVEKKEIPPPSFSFSLSLSVQTVLEQRCPFDNEREALSPPPHCPKPVKQTQPCRCPQPLESRPKSD